MSTVISADGNIQFNTHNNFKYLCGYVTSVKNVTLEILTKDLVTSSGRGKLPSSLHDARRQLHAVLQTAGALLPKPSSMNQ